MSELGHQAVAGDRPDLREEMLMLLEALVELEADNAELRRIITGLLIWHARRHDLVDFALAEVDARWPREPAA